MLPELDASASVFHCMHYFTHTLPAEQGLSCSSFLSYSAEVFNKGHVNVESGGTSVQPPPLTVCSLRISFCLANLDPASRAK